MSIDASPLRNEHLDDAALLLAGAYDRQRSSMPLLPERAPGYFRDHLAQCWRDVGVAAFDDGHLCGFMMESMRFGWKGQQAAGCCELSHAVSADDPAAVYRLLYRDLGARWVDEGRHLHIIGHAATDADLIHCLFHLGFGAFLCEQLRNLSSLACDDEFTVVVDPDPALLVELQSEHRLYYRDSPIFLRKDEGDIRAELEGCLAHGDKLLAGADDGEITALFIVGESASEGEGLLLRSSNSAQLKSAFVRPQKWRQGIGTALLARSIAWAREQGYERIFVEHETANIQGAAFWGRHFNPYGLYSMRYVDNTL